MLKQKIISTSAILLAILVVIQFVTFSSCSDETALYYIGYDGNGNFDNVTMNSEIVDYQPGGSFVVKDKDATIYKPGYVFKGWNLEPDGSGTHYDVDETVSFFDLEKDAKWVQPPGSDNDRNRQIKLYAEWHPAYGITYNGNGSTSGTVPAASEHSVGETITVSGNSGNLVKTGFAFDGWNTMANGEGDNYQPAQTFLMPDAAVTLYAQWVATYAVTYNGNGSTSGNAPTDTQSYLTGEQVSVLANTGGLTKTGFTFSGWNTAANGSGQSYAANATFAMGSANVTLYAQWVAVTTYSVTYNGNGNDTGNAPTDTQPYLTGAQVTVLANTGGLTKTGFTFNGWNTAANGSGQSYSANATFAMGSANVTLFAQWTPVGGGSQFNVSYDGNGNDGGTAPTDNTNYAANAEVTVLSKGSLALTGFTFGGWNTTLPPPGLPFDPSTHYNAGDKFNITGNVTLYAEWIGGGGGPGIYQMIYDGNGNTSGSAPIDNNFYTQGTQVSVYGNMIGNLAKTGFTFSGWNTKADGTGTHYAGDGTAFLIMGTSNIRLYAEWQ